VNAVNAECFFVVIIIDPLLAILHIMIILEIQSLEPSISDGLLTDPAKFPTIASVNRAGWRITSLVPTFGNGSLLIAPASQNVSSFLQYLMG
jgi:hypothetical protein